jgi:hypothetical protein
MSEKDLEHYVTGATKKVDLETGGAVFAAAPPPQLPTIARSSSSSKISNSFEQFRKNGFIDSELEALGRKESIKASMRCETKDRKKTRLTLFN